MSWRIRWDLSCEPVNSQYRSILFGSYFQFWSLPAWTCPRFAMAEPAQKKARTTRTFLFSSESVNEGPQLSRDSVKAPRLRSPKLRQLRQGHPDKICDQVSDAVLDACLKVDPKSKVACETATKDNMVMVAGAPSLA